MNHKKKEFILFEPSGKNYWHENSWVESIFDAESFNLESDAIRQKNDLEQIFKTEVEIMPIVKTIQTSESQWNVDAMIKDMDEYFRNTPKEQIREHLEQTGVPMRAEDEIVTIGELEDGSFKLNYDKVDGVHLLTVESINDFTQIEISPDKLQQIRDIVQKGLDSIE